MNFPSFISSSSKHPLWCQSSHFYHDWKIPDKQFLFWINHRMFFRCEFVEVIFFIDWFLLCDTWTLLSWSIGHVYVCLSVGAVVRLLKPGALPLSAALLTLGPESSIWVSHCAQNLPFALATCTAVSVKNEGITSRTKRWAAALNPRQELFSFTASHISEKVMLGNK